MDVGNLPKRLLICGVPHVVKYVDKIKGVDGEIVYGMYHQRDRVIEIATNPQHSQETLLATLLHECIHGILYLSGHSEELDGGKEEALVIALEHGLVGVIPQLTGVTNDRQKAKKTNA